jgi:adenosylcobinamide-GDP ribazoletransferase
MCYIKKFSSNTGTAMKIDDYLKTFLAALGFLSLAPVGRGETLSPDEFGRLPAFFPMVGLVFGAGMYIVWQAGAALALPPDLTALLVVVFLVVFNRGFHLDGLADTADALFSHKPLAQKLLILKDSRQGTFGVLAIVLDIMINTQLAARLGPAAPWALILWPVWGRLGVSVVAVRSNYVGAENGLGRWLVEKSGPQELYTAALFGLILNLFFGAAAFLTTLAAGVFGLFLVWLWRRALGGVTGDLLGASVELTEIFSVFIFCLLKI